MEKVLIVKGNPKALEASLEEAAAFYGMLTSFAASRDCLPEVFAPQRHGDTIPQELLRPAAYLIAHSMGTLVASESYSPQQFPAMRGIMYFDPLGPDRDEWNEWDIPKRAFVSRRLGVPYAYGYGKTLLLDDGHYFLNSFGRIQEEMRRIIR